MQASHRGAGNSARSRLSAGSGRLKGGCGHDWPPHGAKSMWHCAILLAAASVFLITVAALAQPAPVPLNQLIHSSWTQIEGDTIAPTAMAQTADGVLWLGTRAGLVWFDGAHFVRWKPYGNEQLPGERITALRASITGGLWLCTSAGLAKLEHGHLTNYTTREGLPAGQVLALIEDHDGTVFVGTAGTAESGLASLTRGGPHVLARVRGLPDPAVLSLFEDSRHEIWVGTAGGVCRATSRAVDSCWLTKRPTEILSMAEDSEGHLLAIDGNRGILAIPNRPLGTPAAVPREKVPAARTLLTDRQGSLWIGTLGQGLFQLHGAKLEHFTRREGLTSDLVETLFEDREGNLWVATAGGLDLFREPKARRWSTSEGLSGNLVTAVCAARHGGVWVGTAGGGLNRLRQERFSPCFSDSGLKQSTVISLYEDPHGRLWVGTTRGFGYWSQGRLIEFRAPGGAQLDRVFAIAAGPGGDLWLADSQRGLLRVRGTRTEAAGMPQIPAGKVVYELASRANGELWIGFYDGGVAVLGADQRIAVYRPEDGLAPGAVQSIYEDSAGAVWVAAAGGLSRFRGGRWTTWSKEQGLPPGGVQSVAEDAHHGLWIGTAGGLLRLEQSDLNRENRSKPLSFSVYGPLDGIRLPTSRKMANPRMAASGDGRLWISTEDGLASIDPARVRSTPQPPPVMIERVLVDGRPVDADRQVAFRGRGFELYYTALSLTAPEMVKFRYQLEGFDPGWTVTTARHILYVNLPPGHYRFRLTAANADGVWNPAGAELAVHHRPYLYQTWVFRVILAGAIAMCAYGIYWMRMRQLRSRFRLVLQERSRLTHELHDTVLQGFVGVVYQLEAASLQFDKSPELAKQRLTHALDRAEQSLAEARRAMLSMRLTALDNHSLPEALLKEGRNIVEGTSIGCDMTITGRARPLRYDIEAALFLIAREAVNNAVNHARPQRVAVTLDYSGPGVRLAIRDDGIGFDPHARTDIPGHLGLAGIEERARQIAASLTLDSQPGKGTVVEIALAKC